MTSPVTGASSGVPAKAITVEKLRDNSRPHPKPTTYRILNPKDLERTSRTVRDDLTSILLGLKKPKDTSSEEVAYSSPMKPRHCKNTSPLKGFELPVQSIKTNTAQWSQILNQTKRNYKRTNGTFVTKETPQRDDSILDSEDLQWLGGNASRKYRPCPPNSIKRQLTPSIEPSEPPKCKDKDLLLKSKAEKLLERIQEHEHKLTQRLNDISLSTVASSTDSNKLPILYPCDFPSRWMLPRKHEDIPVRNRDETFPVQKLEKSNSSDLSVFSLIDDDMIVDLLKLELEL